MGIKVGEVGKIININASFDLSGNTDLILKFTAPSGTILSVNKAGGVSAPAVPFTDPVSGTVFNANEYWSYSTTSTDFTESGSWRVAGRYIDATPKDFCGDVATFTVLPCG